MPARGDPEARDVSPETLSQTTRESCRLAETPAAHLGKATCDLSSWKVSHQVPCRLQAPARQSNLGCARAAIQKDPINVEAQSDLEYLGQCSLRNAGIGHCNSFSRCAVCWLQPPWVFAACGRTLFDNSTPLPAEVMLALFQDEGNACSRLSATSAPMPASSHLLDRHTKDVWR